ncbi:MAG TPA: hypothetical protein VHD63_17035 [Ktedonobacteraceae bacterium]|jgi:hypothetical protein|nr:hypothetical protein [Ktedonobacteraceae bacterium]
MNINEQLGKLLEDLGVEMEYPNDHSPANEDSLPEVSIFQSSRDHYGVFYRLDIIDQTPQLRIIVPVDNGPLKMEVYLVQMSERLPLNDWFAGVASHRGSPAFERGREAALQHLLYAVAEMQKQLFWSGDLDSMSFPAEITVQRLI